MTADIVLNRVRIISRRALGLAVLVVLPGCSWVTSNVATVEPLETSYPVSASKQYFDNNGNIVTENDYQVVKPFEFTRIVKGARHDETVTRLRLEPDLDRIMTESGGNAITHLKMEGAEYSPGGQYVAAGWKYGGWTFSLVGAPTLAVAGVLAITGDLDRDSALLPLGGGALGLGILGFVLAAVTANEPAKWSIRVTGRVVRRNAPAPPVARCHGDSDCGAPRWDPGNWPQNDEVTECHGDGDCGAGKFCDTKNVCQPRLEPAIVPPP